MNNLIAGCIEQVSKMHGILPSFVLLDSIYEKLQGLYEIFRIEHPKDEALCGKI